MIVHRADTGRSYRGIPMHAAAGVHEYALAIATASLPRGANVLDVGTGSGALTARLMDNGFEVTACDRDGSDFRGGSSFVPWNLDESDIPVQLASQTFDGACAIEILEHVENPSSALRGLYRIVRPGGIVIVSTPNLTHPRSRLKFFVRGAPAYFGPDEFFSSGHRSLLPPWLLERLMTEAGFEAIETSYAGLLGLRGGARFAYAAAKPFFRVLRMQPEPITGDGCIVFMRGTRPG